MKISKLRNIAWVFFALVLTSTTVFAEGRGNRNRANFNENGSCLSQVFGLNEKQQTQIAEMEKQHLVTMYALRTKRQSTTNAIEKSEIRTEMLKKVEAHRNSVKKVLNTEQLKQYEQLHVYGNQGRNQQFGNGRGNGRGQGLGNGKGQFTNGRGNGNSQFARGNTCNSNANFRGQGGNFQNGNGKRNGNRNYCPNNGNNFRRQNANYGAGLRNGNSRNGNGRFNQRDSCAVYNSQNMSDKGFQVIE